jgi:hypothetical protein
MRGKIATIGSELKHHAPFTLFGAATGIVCMLLFHNAGQTVNHRLFLVFHPTHVVLSAMVTASLFKRYETKTSLLKLLVIGYLGGVGVATVSDSVLPFFGESVLGVALPTHADLHHHHDHDNAASAHDHLADNQDDHSHDHGMTAHNDHPHEGCAVRPRLHLGFIEDWYVVNPAALLGIFIAYFWPRTTFPHAGHVLISTWASSFHVLMNTHAELTAAMLVGVFVVLFVAVWLPCCVSDIVFPLLFIKSARPHAHAHGTPKPEVAS